MTTISNAAADDRPEDRAEQVLRAIARTRSHDFSGVGVVFYEHLARLPHLQLTNGFGNPDLGHVTEVELADALLGLSAISNPLHDGFHFVAVRTWKLTHLSQFISPPIPANAAWRFHGTGARLMAALLASLQPGIACVGLVSQAGEVHLFANGVDAAAKD
ncbi:hypothetical protein [Roseateles sp. P5_E7]